MAAPGACVAEHVSPERYRPYELSLCPEDVEVYEAALEGLLALWDCVPLPSGTGVEFAAELADRMRRDIPELFYVGGTTVTFRGSRLRPRGVALRPTYRLGTGGAASLLDQMERSADLFLADVSGLDRYGRVLAAHDWLAGRLRYADGNRAYAHEAPGPLVYGVGVCEGAAKALKFLCDRCGVRCGVVVGEALGDGDEKGGPHAWNVVEVEGAGREPVWANVDVTFDATISHGAVRHDYLCLSDAALAKTHRRDAGEPLPVCEGVPGYYARLGLVASSASRLVRIVDTSLGRAGALEFLLPVVADDHEVLLDAVEQVLEGSRALAGHAYALYPNFDTGVFGLEVLS